MRELASGHYNTDKEQSFNEMIKDLLNSKRYKYDKDFPIISDGTDRAYVRRGEKGIMIRIWDAEPYVNNPKMYKIYYTTYEDSNRLYYDMCCDCEWCDKVLQIGEGHARHECGCKVLCDDCVVKHDAVCKPEPESEPKPKRKLRNPDHNPKDWAETQVSK
jgi:hypothetical protein